MRVEPAARKGRSSDGNDLGITDSRNEPRPGLETRARRTLRM